MPVHITTGSRDGAGADPGTRQPAYQTLADELREQIASGRLRPGERLPTEPQLCVRSGLSRSTVREALRLLSSQHLIVTTRGVTGGSFVAEPDPELLGESLGTAMRMLCAGMPVSGGHFMEIRELLEVPGAALAAQRRTEEELRVLRGHLVDPAEPDVEAKLTRYWSFRTALAATAHNPLFELLVRPLRRMANDRELVAAGPADLWHRTAAADRLIFECVHRGDPDGAAEATRAHLRHLRGLWQETAVLLAG